MTVFPDFLGLTAKIPLNSPVCQPKLSLSAPSVSGSIGEEIVLDHT
ncbi:MAG: hypothetical protein ACKO9H_16110 [Planctomycetota bacterium]